MKFNVLDYCKSENITTGLQAAINDAATVGGGVVVIPRGNYTSSTVELKSNVTLHLETGAVLNASPNIQDYPEIGFYHNELAQVTSFIYGMGCSNIRIEGSGIIDLSGDSFYDFSRPEIPSYMKDIITPTQEAECTVHYDVRVKQPIFFHGCYDIKVTGVTIRNSPCWTLTFSECEDINVSNVSIYNSLNIPNCDGIHLCSCKNAIIKGCNIVSGDDCIAMTCITNWYKPCENVTISDCIMTSCSKTISIGYSYSVVRNVVISNCIIQKSNRGIAFMATDGIGLVENVCISNCIVDTQVRAGNWWGNGEPLLLMATPHNVDKRYRADGHHETSMRNIQISNVICTSENLIGVVGVNNNIKDVTFRDVTVNLKESKNKHLKGNIIDVSPSAKMPIIPDDGRHYIMMVENAHNVELHNVRGYGMNGEAGEVLIK
ncbi:MAG: glycosyl hydrolase family 28 protein [Defluviitaleaceae bacterium]|nr:glycosyl hydrolase family 28 protein [Defluviitaleaceae bacterium]